LGSADAPDVSVIIINWNTRDYLAALLDSLQQGGLDGVKAEVWVVDNASSDGSADLVRACYPWVRLQANDRNLGFAAANNAVMRAARGRFFLLLNADMLMPPGTVSGLAARLASRPEVGVASCRQLDVHGRELESYLFDFMGGKMPLAGGPLSRPTEPGEVEVAWVWGSGMMVRRETFEQVGGFDEHFFLYYEDIEWCWRVRRAGWRIICCPDLHLTHFVRRSTAHVPPKLTARRLVEGELALMERHTPRRRFRKLLLGRFLYSLRGVVFYRLMLALAPCERFQSKYYRYLASVYVIAGRARWPRRVCARWARLMRGGGS
jgi:hypothetical protein